MRLFAALPIAALFLSPGSAEAAPSTFQAHLAFLISTPNGQRQANTALTQVDLRKNGGGKWSLVMTAAEYDASSYHAGKITATCQVTSSEKDDIVTAYKLVIENLNKAGVEIVCSGAVSGPGSNSVDLQQAGHIFTIMNHA
jgi:hypothetical protein